MIESILTSVKNKLGIPEDYDAYDDAILMDINTVLSMTSRLLGVGKEGFVVEDDSATWDDFIEDRTDIEYVKTYVCTRVRMMFDTPTSGPLIGEYNKQLDKMEWMLSISDNVGGS